MEITVITGGSKDKIISRSNTSMFIVDRCRPVEHTGADVGRYTMFVIECKGSNDLKLRKTREVKHQSLQ
jgi:hypothetical protein